MKFVYRGHGTFDLHGEVVATVCGVVERVNKLIYVRALRARLSMKLCSLIFFDHDDSLISPFPWFIIITYFLMQLSMLVIRYKPEVGDIVVGRVMEVKLNAFYYFHK